MQILRPPPLPPPLVGAQGYHMFPLFKPVVGQNIALHAAPAYRASTNVQLYFPQMYPILNGLRVFRGDPDKVQKEYVNVQTATFLTAFSKAELYTHSLSLTAL